MGQSDYLDLKEMEHFRAAKYVRTLAFHKIFYSDVFKILLTNFNFYDIYGYVQKFPSSDIFGYKVYIFYISYFIVFFS